MNDKDKEARMSGVFALGGIKSRNKQPQIPFGNDKDKEAKSGSGSRESGVGSRRVLTWVDRSRGLSCE